LAFTLAAYFCGFLAPEDLFAATFPAGFVETEIMDTYEDFVGVTFDATGRVYAWDRIGRVWIVENDVKLPTPLLDISPEVGAWDDYGLLGVALHPNFLQNGYIYLLYVVDHHYLANFGTPSYNPAANDYHRATIGRLTRYTARASDGFHSVDPNSRTILVGETASTGFPITFYTHGVGTLLFGADGSLLASCGDGGALTDGGSAADSYYSQALSEGILRPKENIGAFRSQLVDCLNGKILRLDPLTGNGLPSNPFYDAANPRSARSRVYALGLRNPYRMCLRPGTGSPNIADGNPGVLYIGDVGYYTWDEMSVCTQAGQNFGWPIFEGYSDSVGYVDLDPPNQDAPNPLYGTGGCTERYFTFRDLLKEATLGTVSWPNPCNPAQPIPISIPRFVHTRPVADWKHDTGPSRVGIFVGTNASVINIGASGSPVSGPQFPGNCSIGGAWHPGTGFPAQYQNTYFHADLGGNWIRNFTFDSNHNLISVRDFSTNALASVDIAIHPTSGALYYIPWTDNIRKVTYPAAANLPPTAVATQDKVYGPSPLTVQFNGSGSTDPEGRTLTYRWNFGDGTTASTQANPSHIFNAPVGVPTRYNITLTVTDPGGATNATRLFVTVNNSPPAITITSPTNGMSYPVTGDTVWNLTATVTDAEDPLASLSPQWQTVLHHNTHVHTNPVDTNWVTTTVTSPFGCDGDTYFYRITLTVTDSLGLANSAFVDLFPDCTNNPPEISVVSDQTTAEDTSIGPIPFTVIDDHSVSSLITLSVDSDNPALVPTSNLVLGGTGTNRTLTISPAPNQTGAAGISIVASDGALASTNRFTLTVTPVNDPPTLSPIPDQFALVNQATPLLPITVGDRETPAANLQLTGNSSNLGLVPAENILFTGSGASRFVQIMPATNQTGVTTVTVTVSDGQLSTNRSFLLSVQSSPPFPGIKINFQPAAAIIPNGYFPDAGWVFGPRTNGFNFGWDVDNTANALDRNSTRSPDQRYDTFNQLQRPGGGSVWEIAVPNGRYSVFAVAGDPTSFNGSSYQLNVEGVLLISGVPLTGSRWVTGSNIVTVLDGRLSVSNAAGALNNKICFIDISAPLDAPFRLGWIQRDNAGHVTLSLQGVQGRSYELQASGDLQSWITVATVQNSTGTIAFNDPGSVGMGQRFYRARFLP
jgi:glucose/arabinose dehydrogenase